MISRGLLLSALLGYAAQSVAAKVDKAILYSEEACEGTQQEITPDGNCFTLSADLSKKVSGARVPEGVVCDFYSDAECTEPLWIGMEDPGTCSFSELEIDNQAVGVLCYDDTERDDLKR